jgi:hypothetical protein
LRKNPVRAGVLFCYSSLTAVVWLLPFFLAWYAYLLILAAAAAAFKYVKRRGPAWT